MLYLETFWDGQICLHSIFLYLPEESGAFFETKQPDIITSSPPTSRTVSISSSAMTPTVLFLLKTSDIMEKMSKKFSTPTITNLKASTKLSTILKLITNSEKTTESQTKTSESTLSSKDTSLKETYSSSIRTTSTFAGEINVVYSVHIHILIQEHKICVPNSHFNTC